MKNVTELSKVELVKLDGGVWIGEDGKGCIPNPAGKPSGPVVIFRGY